MVARCIIDRTTSSLAVLAWPGVTMHNPHRRYPIIALTDQLAAEEEHTPASRVLHPHHRWHQELCHHTFKLEPLRRPSPMIE